MAPQLPGTILVIDDEGSFVRALTRLLRRDGYHVDTARNGRHALTQLQARPYDVILCDLIMPRMNGFAFVSEYRALALRDAAAAIIMSAAGPAVTAIRRAIQDVLQASPPA